ncbi:hypothetical protein C8R47DRAFT_392695 [Mycena vitilis]|nr:hypothetical protein C8R47DRAFT_392695 [Mycena vitilis]
MSPSLRLCAAVLAFAAGATAAVSNLQAPSSPAPNQNVTVTWSSDSSDTTPLTLSLFSADSNQTFAGGLALANTVNAQDNKITLLWPQVISPGTYTLSLVSATNTTDILTSSSAFTVSASSASASASAASGSATRSGSGSATATAPGASGSGASASASLSSAASSISAGASSAASSVRSAASSALSSLGSAASSGASSSSSTGAARAVTVGPGAGIAFVVALGGMVMGALVL